MGVMVGTVVLERLPRWATEDAGKGTKLPRLTRAGSGLLLGVLFVPVVFFIWLSRYDLAYAEFPDVSETPVLKYISGAELTGYINDFTDWFVGGVDGFTTALKDGITEWMINPFEDLLSDSPWWLMALVLIAIAYVLGGWKPAVITVGCEAVIFWTGLWNDTMVTLAMTLIATVLVMLFAVVLGVAMGRNRRADLGIRPFLDAFQVIPPFVYLVPALALFGVGRFTAIMAAVAYSVPIATKLVADGIRGVSPTTVEAARSTGSTTWQMISKVQLPMAREALVLATNQGLLYVLSMVVIGGMVGGGSLGYLVVSGFSQDQLFGKGLAAGIAIAALGIMLDRIARYAAARAGTMRTTSADDRGARKGRSMARGLRRTRHVALATVVGLGLAACGGGNIEEDEPSTASDCGDLTIAINPWTGYVSNAHVIGVVAEQELGCTVDYPEVKEEVGWQGMADGSIDTIVENWGHPDLIKKYIDEQGTVRGRRADRQRRHHRLVRPAVAGRGAPRGPRLGEPQRLRE